MYRWAQRYFGQASRNAESALDDAGDADTSRQSASDEGAAARRDKRAAEENSAASARDRAARDDRERAAVLRRSDAGSEGRTELPPDTHAEDIRLIGQAQGTVMAARDLTAAEALLTLYQRANTDGTDLRTTALRILDEHAKP